MQHIRCIMLAASLFMLTYNTTSTFAMTGTNTALQEQKPFLEEMHWMYLTSIKLNLWTTHEIIYVNKEEQAQKLINALQDLVKHAIQFEIENSSEKSVGHTVRGLIFSASSIYFFYKNFMPLHDATILDCLKSHENRTIIAQAAALIAIPVSGLGLYYSHQKTKILEKIDADLNEHNNQDLMNIDIFDIPTAFLDRVLDIVERYESETNTNLTTIKQLIQHDKENITEYIENL